MNITWKPQNVNLTGEMGKSVRAEYTQRRKLRKLTSQELQKLTSEEEMCESWRAKTNIKRENPKVIGWHTLTSEGEMGERLRVEYMRRPHQFSQGLLDLHPITMNAQESKTNFMFPRILSQRVFCENV